MTLKSAASRVGNGFVDVMSAVHDASIRSQITEIDSQTEALVRQLADLHEKKTKLESELIN